MPERDVEGMVRGLRLFARQIEEKRHKPTPVYPWEELTYIMNTMPELLDACEKTMKREAEKDAEIARLKMDNTTTIRCTQAIIHAMGMLAQCALPECKQSGYTHSLSDFYDVALELEPKADAPTGAESAENAQEGDE